MYQKALHLKVDFFKAFDSRIPKFHNTISLKNMRVPIFRILWIMFYHSAKVASLVLTLSLDLTLVHCDILVKLILIFCYFWPWQDREFVEMDLPFNGAPKRLAPSSSNPPSPSPSDAIANSIFTNCCGKTNCCRKVSTWKKYIFPLPRNAFPREGTGVKTDFFSTRKFHFWRS